MTPEQRKYADEEIQKAVAKFLNRVKLLRPIAEHGEDAVLKIRVCFTSDPNVFYNAKNRDDIGQYLEVQFTSEHTESA